VKSILRRAAAGLPGAIRFLVLAILAGWACSGQPGGAPAVEIEVALAGGPDSGMVAVESEEMICTEGLVGSGSWGLQYSDPQLTTVLGNLQLVVPAMPAGGSTTEFYFGVVFGSFLDGVDHEIESRREAGRLVGSGVVRIEEEDSSASFRILGRSGDGIGISATIHCRRVRRLALDGGGRHRPVPSQPHSFAVRKP